MGLKLSITSSLVITGYFLIEIKYLILTNCNNILINKQNYSWLNVVNVVSIKFQSFYNYILLLLFFFK